MSQFNSVDTDQDKQVFFADRLPEILGELSYAEENNCLKVAYKSTVYFVHFNGGQMVYATNSLAPFERLERHLRRLSNQNPQIDNSIIKQPRNKFKNNLKTYVEFPTDYKSIIWLMETGHLTTEEAITVIRRMTREVFESFLCLPDSCQFKVIPRSNQIKELCRFDLKDYTEQCKKRLDAWQAFAEKIYSSYQRPYLVTVKDKVIGGLSVEQNENMYKLLRGLNFRQISAIIDRDELVVAKILYPSMLDNTIIVRAPKSPFDQLPSLPLKKNIFEIIPSVADWHGDDGGFQVNSHSKQTVTALENTCKVAYVDNDLAAQHNLTKYLEPSLFSIVAILDAMNAFSELIESQPSLIILSVEMPELNGYELCSLLKNHHDFQKVPIIMVNEAPELINISKSKRAGAIASLAKPLERKKLLNIIWQHVQ